MIANDALRDLLAGELRIALDLGAGGSLEPADFQRWAEDRARRMVTRLANQRDRRYEGAAELFNEDRRRGNRNELPERR